MTAPIFTCRDLTDLSDCHAVVEVQVSVWGRDAETVPASVLLVSAKRGGILIGAFDATRLVGFVWSMPGWRDGRPTHWSHMLGVLPEARGHGVGARLKRAQRERALAQGVDLIEWTFDPLQAANAHLNIACLGAMAATYLVDAYGAMSGPLHRGTPTDRLVAEWWLARPHVERRLAARDHLAARRSGEPLPEPVVAVRAGVTWAECAGVRLDLEAPRLTVPVPPRFTDMQQQAPDAALAWRLALREALPAYFARGYRVVEFFFDRDEGSGEYLLARKTPGVIYASDA
jgi:predicted GNAT superfamily acetyltransferase